MFIISVAASMIGYALQTTVDGFNTNSANQAATDLNETIGGSVNSVSKAAADTSFGEKVLDFFTMGMYNKLEAFADRTIFALPTLLIKIGLIDDSLAFMLNTILSFVYISAIISLFSKGFNNVTDDF